MARTHPNLTMLSAWILSALLCVGAIYLSQLGTSTAQSSPPQTAEGYSAASFILLLLALVVVVFVDTWALSIKKRSALWVLLAFVPVVGGLLPIAVPSRSDSAGHVDDMRRSGVTRESSANVGGVADASASSVWTTLCPSCHSSALEKRRYPGFLGIGAQTYHKCGICGAVFVAKGTQYVLRRIDDVGNPVWQEYHDQALREDEWQRIAHGGMSDAKQHDCDIAAWMTALVEGRVPLPRMRCGQDIMLHKGEEVCVSLDNIQLLEPRSVRTSYGGYTGPTIRIAKGLSWRVGAFASRSTSHEEIQTIDSGVLTLTTKRLVFLGSKRNATADLSKILAMEPYSDGICVVTSGRQRPQYFLGLGPQGTVSIVVSGRDYHEPLSGPILESMIVALVRNAD